MSKVFLVRHGEAAAHWGREEDPGLSELGVQQAMATAKKLSSLLDGPVRLLSSPKRRALETAEPLAEALGLQVEIEPRFREIPAPVALSERKAWLQHFMTQVWTGQAEALQQWRRGVIEASLACQQANVVVFSHFLVINTLLAYVQGRDETLSFWPDNASITCFENSDTGLALLSLGDQIQTVVN